MVGDRAAEGAKGQLTSGIDQQDNLVLRAIDFVYGKLPEWRDYPERPQMQSEPKLNPHLCKFLERHARSDFPLALFSHEEPQTGRRSADIGASTMHPIRICGKVYGTSTPFLIIECKRLPADFKDREREYITGGEKRNGGIQRFKLGLYASNEECAVLIGYIQSKDSKYWHRTILSWMKELAEADRQSDGTDWGSDECFEPLSYSASKKSARWLSRHSRTGGISNGDISVYHLWIEMTSA